jgi:hypothetical protein
MGLVRYPSLYQVNTRVVLGERARELGRPATLSDLDGRFLDELAARGFDILWPLGVWQTGDAGRAVSRGHPEWRREFAALLPDLSEEDICGSPFAIRSYDVHPAFGGDAALATLRERLRDRGMRLLLDFVPNHVALDHPWVSDHPSFLVGGTEEDLAREPQNYVRLETGRGPGIFAYGRDPYFPGWPDTVQLNYRCAALREAMIAELLRVAGLCDGVRCDMAMLLLPDVIRRTWGEKSVPADGTPPVDAPFWPEAVARVRAAHPGFLFMAEVYWDLEWELQRQGFDYTYDKRLYDRLAARDAAAVRGHLLADPEFMERSVRFLENHDEPRAASEFPPGAHRAAATIAFLIPGLRFFHEGQFEGRRARVSMHLARRPPETPDPSLQEFYSTLLKCCRIPAVRKGSWRLHSCRPAWEGNRTWDRFVAFSWEGAGEAPLLVAVNFGPTRGQCYVEFPFAGTRGGNVLLCDRLGEDRYERDCDDLARNGLYLDVPEWQSHAFQIIPR